jgi:hypothetical protein
VAKERKLVIPWLNLMGLIFLKREKIDNTINLRKEGILVEADQMLDLIIVQVKGQLVDNQTLKVVLLKRFQSRRCYISSVYQF